MERKGDDGGTGPRRQRGVRDKGEGDGRTEEQGQGGKRNGKQKDRRTEKKGKGKGRQKDKRTEEQKDKRTKTGGKGNRKKGARGPEKARKLSPAALEQPYRALGAMLQLSCSIVTELLEKFYGGGWELRRNTWNDAVLPPKENIFGILFGRYKKNRYLCNAFRKHGRLAQLV